MTNGTFRRIVAAAALLLSTLVAVVALPSAAHAAPCIIDPAYTGTPTIAVDPPGPVEPGQQITVTGSNFPPNCEVDITINGTVAGTVTTNPDGSFVFGYTLGSNISGTVTVGAVAGNYVDEVVLPVRQVALDCQPKTLTFGDPITCTATGFRPFTTSGVNVDFFANPSFGSAPADAAGTAVVSLNLPAQSLWENGGCGPQTVTAVDDLDTASDVITVTCPTTGDLPRTGSDSTMLVGAGVGLVAVGGLVLLATRKREQAAA